MAMMNKLKRLCYIGSFLIFVAYQQEVYAANQALIIGNSQYTHMNALTNPVHDADAINNTLKKLGFQTTVIKDAPKRKMLEAIDSFSQGIGAGDTIIFFYAGHGASINGNNYLIPSTASLPEKDIFFDEEFIDLDSKIASRLSNSPARYKIMIMDACRDNPVAQTRSTATRALARMDTSPNAAGLSILYSASKGQKADDGIGQSNSPFTLSLLKYLNTPNLTWATLVEDVTHDVAKQTKKQQQVWQEGNPLARLVLNVQEIKPPLEQENAEITAWNKIKNSQNVDDFKSFIKQYPTGLFSSAAQALIYQLTPREVISTQTNTLTSTGEWKITQLNQAQWVDHLSEKKQFPIYAKLQVLLNQNFAATGRISGYLDSNTRKAIASYEKMNGFTPTGIFNQKIWQNLQNINKPTFIEYHITASDLNRSYIKAIPNHDQEKVKMKNLTYTRVSEMLADRFYMEESFLQQINPQAKFDQIGEKIIVANMSNFLPQMIHKIVAHKGAKQMFLFNNDKLIATFPIIIGSHENPLSSLSGTDQIKGIAINPSYTPKNTAFVFPSGANNPIGNVKIDLVNSGCSIHGMPSLSSIKESPVYGCIRLSNHNISILAKYVNNNTSILFVE